MRLKLGALMMTLLLGLTACAGGQSASGLDAKFRSYYAALTGFSGRCTVTADYGTRFMNMNWRWPVIDTGRSGSDCA